VLPGGAIRYERQRHQWRKAGKVEVAEGALPPEALNELKQLLNSPVLVAVDMPADLFPSWVSVADVDSFSIPRGDTVQHLGAGMLFRSSGNFGAPRALGEPKIVRPLVRWFEKNIVKSKFAKSVAATANGCRYVTDQIASTPSKP
jgi:hypothetical protein